MISDLLISFKENIKSKTTNPFFGTLIIVWIIHNWRLVYTFFNFPEGTILRSRIQFLATYLDPNVFVFDLIKCILISFAVLISTYFLLNLSRLIVNFYEKVITPFVYEITDKGSVVQKSVYQQMIEERNRFEKKYEQEHESRLKLINEMEKLEARLISSSADNTDKQNFINENSISSSLDNHLLNLKNDVDLRNSFGTIILDILNNRISKTSKNSDKLLLYGLIELRSGESSYQGSSYFKLTLLGQKLKDFLVRENPNWLDEITP